MQHIWEIPYKVLTKPPKWSTSSGANIMIKQIIIYHLHYTRGSSILGYGVWGEDDVVYITIYTRYILKEIDIKYIGTYNVIGRSYTSECSVNNLCGHKYAKS